MRDNSKNCIRNCTRQKTGCFTELYSPHFRNCTHRISELDSPKNRFKPFFIEDFELKIKVLLKKIKSFFYLKGNVDNSIALKKKKNELQKHQRKSWHPLGFGIP